MLSTLLRSGDAGGGKSSWEPLSPFLSLPCSKEKEERKLETFALCIVSCQKDKMVLGANKGPLRAAVLDQGVSLFDTPLLPPDSRGTTPVGMGLEGHGDAFRNAIRHTSANTQKPAGTLCRREPPLCRACPAWCLESQ